VFIGGSVSMVKYKVIALRSELKKTERKIQESLDNIRVLNAEWSCLIDPQRLKILCNKYLPLMKTIDRKQIIKYTDIKDKIFTSTKNEKNEKKGLRTLIDNIFNKEKKRG
jgi:hypothetical protein